MEFVIKLVIVVVLVALFALVARLANGTRKNSSSKDKMSFKETFDLTELPIITFKLGEQKLNFVLDTGASRSVINEPTLEGLEITRFKNVGQLYGADGNKIQVDSVELELSYNNTNFSEHFRILDLTEALGNLKKSHGVTVHGFLGNSFFQKYRYVINFEELVAYPSNE